MITERVKFVELLKETDEYCHTGKSCNTCVFNKKGACNIQSVADHLLADGEIKHAFELLKAEKEGRLYEAPCKVGDNVYSFCDTFGGVLEYFVENLNIAYFEEDRNYCTYEANCHMNDEFYDSIDFDYDDIGKTVFLSREDAEKALKKTEGN